MSADPDLVWCKRCGVHQALKARGGVCPVCDPRQGNEVGKRAETALERIDAALALPAETSQFDGMRWTPDLENEPVVDALPPVHVNPPCFRDIAGHQPTFVVYDETTEFAAVSGHFTSLEFVSASGPTAPPIPLGAATTGRFTVSIAATALSPEALRILFGEPEITVIGTPSQHTPRFVTAGLNRHSRVDLRLPVPERLDLEPGVVPLVTERVELRCGTRPDGQQLLFITTRTDEGTGVIVNRVLGPDDEWSVEESIGGFEVGRHRTKCRITLPNGCPFTHLFVNGYQLVTDHTEELPRGS